MGTEKIKKQVLAWEHDLQSQEEETILKGGLAKIVSKRTNTSFASDYRTMGLLEEDKHIKHYLDKCEETITT